MPAAAVFTWPPRDGEAASGHESAGGLPTEGIARALLGFLANSSSARPPDVIELAGMQDAIAMLIKRRYG